MKCRGKRDTPWNIPRSIWFTPLHFMLYRGKSITLGTVYYCTTTSDCMLLVKSGKYTFPYSWDTILSPSLDSPTVWIPVMKDKKLAGKQTLGTPTVYTYWLTGQSHDIEKGLKGSMDKYRTFCIPPSYSGWLDKEQHFVNPLGGWVGLFQFLASLLTPWLGWIVLKFRGFCRQHLRIFRSQRWRIF